MEFTGYRGPDENWVSSVAMVEDENHKPTLESDGTPLHPVKLEPDQANKVGDHFVLKSDESIRVESRAYKMSKSRGNVVNPDMVVTEYGADALRLYEMFMGPLEQSKPWSMTGVNGVRNFLDRVWRMVMDEKSEDVELNPAVGDHEPTEEQLRVLHRTIKAVTADLEALSFNTAIARMMEFVNFFTKQSQRPKSIMESFILILSPLAPHIAEEIWRRLGHDQTLAYETWPVHDEALTIDSTLEIPIQILGKVRSKISVPRGISKSDLEAAALADEKIASLIVGKQVRKVIVVPERLVNIVAN